MYSLIQGKKSLFRSFIKDLEKKDLTQLITTIRHVIDHSTTYNKQRFRHVGGNVFEIKTRNGIRITVLNVRIAQGRSLVVVTGFYKGPKKKQNREIEKAKEIDRLFDVNNVDIVDKIEE